MDDANDRERAKERRANLYIRVCEVIPQLLACFVYIIPLHHHRNRRSLCHVVFHSTASFVPEVVLKNVRFSSRPHYTHIMS